MRQLCITIVLIISTIYQGGYAQQTHDYWSVCSNSDNASPSSSSSFSSPISPSTPPPTTLVHGLDTNCICYGYYDAQQLQSGWNYLQINTNPQYSDSLQAYAAGYLEGYLSYHDILNFIQNKFVNVDDSQGISNNVSQYIQQNYEWNQENILNNPHVPYWYHLNLLYTQLTGMVDGINSQQSTSVPVVLFDLIQLNLIGELGDINATIYAEPSPPSSSSSPPSHCSSALYFDSLNCEYYFGHTNWGLYVYMLRVMKTYNLSYSMSDQVSTPIPGQIVLFSSYPGLLYSYDDYYQIYPSNLLVSETSIAVYDTSIYQQNSPSMYPYHISLHISYVALSLFLILCVCVWVC